MDGIKSNFIIRRKSPLCPWGFVILVRVNLDAGNLDKNWLIRKVLKDGEHGIHLEQYPVRSALAGTETLDDL